jgi:hypothetical protein
MTESPAYLLEMKEDNFEIRRYPDYILAQVDVESDYDQAIGTGFSILANYIFGGNRKRSSIPMTTPVSEEKIGDSEKIPMAAPVTQESVESEKIPMAAPVTEESVESEKIPMAAPVTEESVESERIEMTAPVTEESSGKKKHRISFTMPSNYTLKSLPEPDDKRITFKEVKNQRTAVLRFNGRVKHKLAQKKMEEMKILIENHGLKPKSNFVVAQYNNPAVPGFLMRNEIIVEIE